MDVRLGLCKEMRQGFTIAALQGIEEKKYISEPATLLRGLPQRHPVKACKWFNRLRDQA